MIRVILISALMLIGVNTKAENTTEETLSKADRFMIGFWIEWLVTC